MWDKLQNEIHLKKNVGASVKSHVNTYDTRCKVYTTMGKAMTQEGYFIVWKTMM